MSLTPLMLILAYSIEVIKNSKNFQCYDKMIDNLKEWVICFEIAK